MEEEEEQEENSLRPQPAEVYEAWVVLAVFCVMIIFIPWQGLV